MNFLFIIFYLFLMEADGVSSTNFRSVINSNIFVDKTLLIKLVLEKEQRILITTPPKFGKSTNLDMIKTFLEIEVDEYGDPKTLVNITTSPVNDTENYSYFIRNRLEISKYPDTMSLFGKTPVVTVDFKLEVPKTGIRCLYDAVKLCKEVIHNSYKAHEYLLFSQQLSLENKQIVRTWCDHHSYKTKIDTLFMSHGLLLLSQLLQKHFNGVKIFVIVDNHDFLVSRACDDVDKDLELNEIVQFVYSIISDVVNDNKGYVCGALITGVTQIPLISKFNMTNLRIHRFLEDPEYSHLFAVTKKEVEELLKRSDYYLNPKEIQLLYRNHNGFYSKRGEALFSFHPVVMFFKVRRTSRLCSVDAYPQQMREVLKISTIKEIFNRLLRDQTVHVNFSCTSVSEVEVRNYLRGTCNESVDSLLLQYLTDWGLLTYGGNEVQTIEQCDSIRIPNQDVKDFLLDLYGPM